MDSLEREPGASRRLIGDQQNFFAGAVLLAIAAFAWWASSDLGSGTLGNFGPGMLPRIVVGLIALFGLILCIGATRSPGLRVRFADFSALAAVAVLGVAAALAGYVLSAAGVGSVFGLNPVPFAFVLFYILLMLWLVRAALRDPDWLDSTGLRGPIFVIGGLIAFALTVRSTGLLIAGPLLAIISGAASRETRLRELLIFAVVITLFCVALFKYGLKLPMPVLIIPGVIYL